MPMKFDPASIRIGIIGPGHVGLPLAVEFARFGLVRNIPNTV
jgi:UDP-N-acetyl-D-mannosaminuronate dehydrogenase